MIITLQKLLRGAIRCTDLPYLRAVVYRMPFNRSKIEPLSRRNRHSRRCVVRAQHTVRDRMQLIRSRTHIRDHKVPALRTTRPELIVLRIVLPRDWLWRKIERTRSRGTRRNIRAAIDPLPLRVQLGRMIRVNRRNRSRRHNLSRRRHSIRWPGGPRSARHRWLIRKRKPHQQIRKLCRRRLRIHQLQTAFDHRTLISRSIVNSPHPPVRPASRFYHRLMSRIVEQCLRRTTGRHINKNRTNNLSPMLRYPQSSARCRHSAYRASSPAASDHRHHHRQGDP